MTYTELVTELQTQATAQGFDFTLDYTQVINERASKDYPAMLLLPISSVTDLQDSHFNKTYTIEGFVTEVAGTETAVFQTLENKLKAFLNALSEAVLTVKIERIPQMANDKLMALKFSFDYIVTEC